MKIFDKVLVTATLEIRGSDVSVPRGALGIIMHPVREGQRIQVTFEVRKKSTYSVRADALELVSCGR